MSGVRARPARSGPRRRRPRRHRGCRSRPSSRRGSPRRSCPGSIRSTMPAIVRARWPPSLVGTASTSSTVRPSRSASARGMTVEPPASSAASAVARSPATNWSRPSASMSAPTTAAASVRTPVERDIERAIGLRARCRERRCGAVRGRPRRPRSAGSRSRPVARHDVGDPAGGRGTRVLADPTEGDDHGQPDGQRRRASGRSGSGRGRPSCGPGVPRSAGAERRVPRRPGRRPAGRTG